jgi:hypothetical protein
MANSALTVALPANTPSTSTAMTRRWFVLALLILVLPLRWSAGGIARSTIVSHCAATVALTVAIIGGVSATSPRFW